MDGGAVGRCRILRVQTFSSLTRREIAVHDEEQGRHPEARERHQRLNDLLVVTRLVTVFETFDSEAKALASFGSLSAWQIP